MFLCIKKISKYTKKSPVNPVWRTLAIVIADVTKANKKSMNILQYVSPRNMQSAWMFNTFMVRLLLQHGSAFQWHCDDQQSAYVYLSYIFR